MMPFIRPNDTVTIITQLEKKPDVGDIAIFSRNRTGKIFIHRIVAKRFDKFLFKGDNRFLSDGFVDQKDIFGLVGNVERNNRKVYFGVKKGQKIISLFSRLNFLTLYFFISTHVFGTGFALSVFNYIEKLQHFRSRI